MPEQLQNAFAATHATFNQKIPFILTSIQQKQKKNANFQHISEFEAFRLLSDTPNSTNCFAFARPTRQIFSQT